MTKFVTIAKIEDKLDIILNQSLYSKVTCKQDAGGICALNRLSIKPRLNGHRQSMIPSVVLVIKKNTWGDIGLQYHEHVQRIMTLWHISLFLLLQNPQENEFSVLF